MSYPAVSRAEARSFLNSHCDNSAKAVPPPTARIVNEGGDEEWPAIASEIIDELGELRAPRDGSSGLTDKEFEIAAGIVLHRRLPSHPALADPEFWTWFAIQGLDLIEWRYGGLHPKNFGIGSSRENFMYRLWLRADVGYDATEEDAYARARFGDIDFWRSHIFRQSYADARSFARAFIEFQFPRASKGKPHLKILQIRELAKYLKRARTNSSGRGNE